MGDLLPEVALGTGVQAIAVTAGLRHTAAIMDDNSVRAWGYNGKGQLGIGSIVDVGDRIDDMGDNMAVTLLGADVLPMTISAGGWHTCSIVDGNVLKCWGERGGETMWEILCMKNTKAWLTSRVGVVSFGVKHQ